ncbi:hypothetical protein Tco_0396578 [Tanacetum coccineum]
MDLYTKLSDRVLDSETTKTGQVKKIASLKKRVKKLERKRKSRTLGLKRLRKVGSARRVESSNEASLGDQEDASKQGRKIEVEVEKVVITAEVTTASATTTIPAASKPSQDKGKAKMIEFENPLKKKDQIMYDQEVALNLQAQLQAKLEEEERLTRQKEEEANIALIESWDNTQTIMDDDYQMAQQLQAEEQERLSIEEKSKLFVQLLEARKKHFAEIRAREKRDKPPTQA